MDNYERERLIGRGAFGTVYLCNRKSDDRKVIIKQIPVEQLNKLDRQATLNEVKVLSMLHHPNIIEYYENFLQDQTMMIVMEYAAGGTLFDFLEERKGAEDMYVEEDEIADLFAQIVLPLRVVHGRQVLHRDLKTQNIFLTRSRDCVKIGDFGISKILSSKSKAFTVVGTPCYISPELCEGKPYDHKSDIWALGCVLYEMCSLRRAFEAPTLPALVLKILRGTYRPIPAHYSGSLRDLVSSLLAIDPGSRPSLAQIMAHHWLAPHLYRLPTTLGALPCAARQKRKLFSVTSSPQSSFAQQQSSSPSPFSRDKKTSLVVTCDLKKDSKLTKLRDPKVASEFVSLSSIRRDRLVVVGSDGRVSEYKGEKKKLVDGLGGIVIMSVCTARHATFLLTDRGILLTFGKGNCLLGHGDDCDEVSRPKIVEALLGEEIVRVSCDESHACALTSDGEVFAWGDDDAEKSGCLGLDKSFFVSRPHRVHLDKGVAAVADIACGRNATVLRTTEGKLLVAGKNTGNRFGAPLKEDETFACFTMLSSTAAMVALVSDSHMLIVAEDCRSAILRGGERKKDRVLKFGKGQQPTISQVTSTGGNCLIVGTNQGEIFCRRNDKEDEDVILLQQLPLEKSGGAKLSALSLSRDDFLSALFV